MLHLEIRTPTFSTVARRAKEGPEEDKQAVEHNARISHSEIITSLAIPLASLSSPLYSDERETTMLLGPDKLV
jgi:hypothetical protein